MAKYKWCFGVELKKFVSSVRPAAAAAGTLRTNHQNHNNMLSRVHCPRVCVCAPPFVNSAPLAVHSLVEVGCRGGWWSQESDSAAVGVEVKHESGLSSAAPPHFEWEHTAVKEKPQQNRH